VLLWLVRHTFIIFGLFTTPNLCPLTQNPGDATDPWCCETCSYTTTVLNERMWHFKGSKHTLTLPTYFRGRHLPIPGFTPMVATRAVDDQLWEWQYMSRDLWGLLTTGHLHPRFGVLSLAMITKAQWISKGIDWRTLSAWSWSDIRMVASSA